MKFSCNLLENEFLEFCYGHYTTLAFDEAEFKNDIARASMIKKLLNRYNSTGKLNVRIVLNHVTILINVFGQWAGNIILFYKLDETYYPKLKTILLVNNNLIETEFTKNIEIDENLYNLIQKTLDNS